MPSNIPQSGSLKAFMDELEALQQQVVDALADDFEVIRYRWRPRGVPDFPAIYNWLAPSPYELKDVAHGRDRLMLLTNCAIRYSDVDTEMSELEMMADEYRYIVDPELRGGQALGGIPQRADRTNMQTTIDTFGDVDALVIQFQMFADLDRLIA